MKRILFLLLAGVTLAGVGVAQSAQSQAGASASESTKISDKNSQAASTSQLQAGSTVQAELAKPLDARKNKVGDEVIAKTTHDVKSEGRVVIPRGSKLVGHVTEVKAQTKEQATSQLGIAFDRAILKSGEELPLALGIQAIGRSRASAAVLEEDDTMATGSSGTVRSSSPRPAGGAGPLGGVRSTAGGAVDTAGSTAGAAVNSTAGAAGSAVSGSLSATSHGVVGMPGLSLSTQTSTSANASVITAQGTNVHLDSGTEMILRVNQ